jgi:hypothetical protein
MVINGEFLGLNQNLWGYNQDLYATKMMAMWWWYHWDINVQLLQWDLGWSWTVPMYPPIDHSKKDNQKMIRWNRFGKRGCFLWKRYLSNRCTLQLTILRRTIKKWWSVGIGLAKGVVFCENGIFLTDFFCQNCKNCVYKSMIDMSQS